MLLRPVLRCPGAEAALRAGVLNVFGGADGLFARSVTESGVNSARHDLPDGAVLQLHKSDAHHFSTALCGQWKARDEAVWAKETVIVPML